MKVLLTKPKNNNNNLAKMLKENKIEYIIEPFIKTKIHLNESYADNLKESANIIFISERAVNYANQINQNWSSAKQYYAVGEKTAQALAAFNIESLYPKTKPDSANLIKLILETDTKKQKTLIIKGKEGLKYLEEELIKHKFPVSTWSVYERESAIKDINQKIQYWKKCKINIILITSIFSLEQLKAAQKNNLDWLKTIILITTSDRIHDAATRQSFTCVKAENSYDASILSTIVKLKQ